MVVEAATIISDGLDLFVHEIEEKCMGRYRGQPFIQPNPKIKRRRQI